MFDISENKKYGQKDHTSALRDFADIIKTHCIFASVEELKADMNPDYIPKAFPVDAKQMSEIGFSSIFEAVPVKRVSLKWDSESNDILGPLSKKHGFELNFTEGNFSVDLPVIVIMGGEHHRTNHAICIPKEYDGRINECPQFINALENGLVVGVVVEPDIEKFKLKCN